MLDITTLHHEPDVGQFPCARDILAGFPEVDLVEVPSHHGNAGNVRDWVRTKRGVLVLGSKKSLTARPNRPVE
jgi:hypothetical protein